jgi:hypothetical protein
MEGVDGFEMDVNERHQRYENEIHTKYIYYFNSNNNIY